MAAKISDNFSNKKDKIKEALRGVGGRPKRDPSVSSSAWKA